MARSPAASAVSHSRLARARPAAAVAARRQRVPAATAAAAASSAASARARSAPLPPRSPRRPRARRSRWPSRRRTGLDVGQSPGLLEGQSCGGVRRAPWRRRRRPSFGARRRGRPSTRRGLLAESRGPIFSFLASSSFASRAALRFRAQRRGLLARDRHRRAPRPASAFRSRPPRTGRPARRARPGRLSAPASTSARPQLARGALEELRRRPRRLEGLFGLRAARRPKRLAASSERSASVAAAASATWDFSRLVFERRQLSESPRGSPRGRLASRPRARFELVASRAAVASPRRASASCFAALSRSTALASRLLQILRSRRRLDFAAQRVGLCWRAAATASC